MPNPVLGEADFQQWERAWKKRQSAIVPSGVEAYRVFHGPGEGTKALRNLAIDRLGDYAWVTHWQSGEGRFSSSLAASLTVFLRQCGLLGAVVLERPERGVPSEDAQVLFGEVPQDAYSVREDSLQFLVRLRGSRHPGLFLDHRPLRRWLWEHARDWRVLNAFCYTGSLSVACGAGGARETTSMDLSGSTLEWARRNWELNGLPPDRARWIAGDYFERLPRLARQGELFDCVILDPPSFSRGKKGNFSTSRDLAKLHVLALDVLRPGGVLATSINSANVSKAKFEAEVLEAAESRRAKLRILSRIELPDESFPVRTPEERYLKGLIARRD